MLCEQGKIGEDGVLAEYLPSVSLSGLPIIVSYGRDIAFQYLIRKSILRMDNFLNSKIHNI
jgi:hypothetical protein